jgi:CRISPR-associated protein Csh1
MAGIAEVFIVFRPYKKEYLNTDILYKPFGNMIKELINFTKNLDKDFKNLGVSPREGLHIILTIREGVDGIMKIDTGDYQYALYSKKMTEESKLLERCKFLSQNAWCIDTNKCFDLPTKAIHSCSPYLVAFKTEHLKGGKKYEKNEGKTKKQIYERFAEYFTKARTLFLGGIDKGENKAFEHFFSDGVFNFIINEIVEKNSLERQKLSEIKMDLEFQFKEENDKNKKENLKNNIKYIDDKLLSVKELEDSDYILFYLDKPLEEYKAVHKKYLAEKLFNTDKYNTLPNEHGLIYGTSNFMNGFNGSMPFLTHQTASFDITGRISDVEAKLLYDFEQILPRKTLPNPLPIFIYKAELQSDMISLFRQSGFKLGYKELIESLWSNYPDDFANYYLLTWQNSKDGLVFQDFDFVSRFEYELEAQIENLFEIQEKGVKTFIHYPKIKNVFDFERTVFKPLLQSKYLRLDYFNDLKKEDYDHLNNTFQAYAKYRKTVYDYVYKSKRQGMTQHIFSDMIFSHIKDDLKQNNGYSIKEKLNIWFSLYEMFQQSNHLNEGTMASKLKQYQEFVARLSMGEADPITATDEDFAFAAGQVIDYVLNKSKSEDKSYQLLEPYLQQAKCQEFKRSIASDVARYKHAITDSEWRFKAVCEFVLTYDTATNMKELMPEILAGVFSKCQFFTKKVASSIATESN